MKTKLAFLSLITLALMVPVAFAEECNSSCPSGKVMVSFGDGNNAVCSCVDQGQPHNPSETAQDMGCSDENDDGTCE